ncbi:MAG: ABC transporter permease [Sphingobacteriales bacterium]|nr:MAG: ABC transporter permease [Sphingobacteriales bacterium]
MNRTLVWQLAWRYMRGKRSANAVPILSRISMVAIAIGTCAMIVLFSVFNGFELLVRDLYKAFYPELRITAVKGKFFPITEEERLRIQQVRGIKDISYVLEDNILLNSNDEQRVATVKGIDRKYFDVNNIRPFLIDGSDSVTAYPAPTAIVGMQLHNEMGLDVHNVFSILTLYYPNAKSDNLTLDPQSAFQSLKLKPDGIFQVQEEFDGRYLLASLDLVQNLMQAEGQFSSLELSLKDGEDAEDVKEDLEKALGQKYKIETRFEQNRTLYMVMRTEKWAVYAILLLVLLIASLNMIGALSLLVLEKRKDMAILSTMGAQPSTIRSIFVSEGILWSMTGGVAGLLLGTALCLGQQHFQWIKMQGSFIIEAYPVTMQWQDFVLILVTIIIVGLLAAWVPAKRASKAEAPSLRST